MTEEHNFQYTQYIIVNSDVKEMKKGKMCAQVAHASLGAYLVCDDMGTQYEWLSEGARKVVLKASEEKIIELYDKISNQRPNIPIYKVRDYGLTQVPENTLTAIGLGPYLIYILQEYVKDLKLV